MILALDVPPAIVLLGAITGMTYGILAVGLILVYRSSRVINFAHGEIGRFGATLLGLMVLRWGFPYWLAFVIAVLAAALVGVAAETVVVRRLRKAPEMMSIVATLGIAQILLLMSAIIDSSTSGAGSIGDKRFPMPAFLPSFEVGPLLVTPAATGMLVLSPLVVIALAWFLKSSRLGLAMRGASSNAEAARTSGIYSSRMSGLAWAIAGAVAAFTAILILPTFSGGGGLLLGPGLLLRALAVAVVARMSNLPVALIAGIVLGIVESIINWNSPASGMVDAVLFVVILAALLLQPRVEGRAGHRRDWNTVKPWPDLPDHLRSIWLIRNLGKCIGVLCLVATVALAAVVTNQTTITMLFVLAFSVVGLSAGIICGLGGQLSLGQFAIAGVGAVASLKVDEATANVPLGIVAGALVAALVSLVIGLPALRIQGAMLAVATLAFAVAAREWLFKQSWMLGTGVESDRPIINGYAFDTGRRYFFFALVIGLLALWMTHNIWKGSLGRRMRAVRDNENGARAFSMSATSVRLQGFVVSGFIAGIGGGIYAHLVSRLSPDLFTAQLSIDIAASTVLGGVGVMVGPILGALYIIALPRLIPLDTAGLAASAVGWLVLILYFPGGIVQMFAGVRLSLITQIAKLHGVAVAVPTKAADVPMTEPDLEEIHVPDIALTSEDDPSTTVTPTTTTDGAPLLEVANISRSFGGIRAVESVTFELMAGETLGIIGANGAGKTTLFEILAGFTRPDEGLVFYDGDDITTMSPQARARRGLVRSFQDAALFPTMTVHEVVMLAYERAEPSKILPALLGARGSERRKSRQADEMISLMGLGDYRWRAVGELSTGTRRITELACMMAIRPRVLLLDEPASGVAQRDTEALSDVLVRARAELDAAMIVIEHDIPMVTKIADRMIAMESGRIIATGTPAEVCAHPDVIESYLGGDIVAIQRSGATAAGPAGQRDRVGQHEAVAR